VNNQTPVVVLSNSIPIYVAALVLVVQILTTESSAVNIALVQAPISIPVVNVQASDRPVQKVPVNTQIAVVAFPVISIAFQQAQEIKIPALLQVQAKLTILVALIADVILIQVVASQAKLIAVVVAQTILKPVVKVVAEFIVNVSLTALPIIVFQVVVRSVALTEVKVNVVAVSQTTDSVCVVGS
jgi:hypothetical protein